MKIYILPYFIFALVLGSCTTESEKLSASDAAVMGNWAGSMTIGADIFSALLRNNENKTYTVDVVWNGEPLSGESGTWRTLPGRYITRPQICEESLAPGAPLSLVACSGADTLAINVTGDTWNLNFPDAQGVIHTLPMRKI
jgi:hypothetical protein